MKPISFGDQPPNPDEPTENPLLWEREIAAKKLGITEVEVLPPDYDPDDESTFPKFPTPAVQAERNAIFCTLREEFNENFYHEDLPEDESEITACFLIIISTAMRKDLMT
jgi:hypothetical protein